MAAHQKMDSYAEALSQWKLPIHGIGYQSRYFATIENPVTHLFLTENCKNKSQQTSAKAEGLGFKGPRGQVKGPDKHFLAPLAPGILSAIILADLGAPTIKLKSSPKGEGFSPIPRVGQ